MSALPPVATIERTSRLVRFVPNAEVGGSPYSITSLARPTSGSEKVRPSILAALRFMINSTLETCATGRSAGLSPLRILPTKITVDRSCCQGQRRRQVDQEDGQWHAHLAQTTFASRFP
jgi:hypothetical protein